jgi:hypothetical protein
VPDHTLFPSIIPSGEDFVDDSYTAEELNRMERPELQRIASECEKDAVNGQMSNEDIREFMQGETRV